MLPPPKAEHAARELERSRRRIHDLLVVHVKSSILDEKGLLIPSAIHKRWWGGGSVDGEGARG
jgi:hypothetical protein